MEGNENQTAPGGAKLCSEQVTGPTKNTGPFPSNSDRVQPGNESDYAMETDDHDESGCVKSDNSSKSSSTSRISIRIPRNAVHSSTEDANDHGISTKDNLSPPTVASPTKPPGGQSDNEEDATGGSSHRKSKRRPKLARGRKRRGHDDSEESAYSESEASEDSTESEEVYSGDESGESEETAGDDAEEEWDSRRQSYIRKDHSFTAHHSYVPPMSMPFQYSTGMGPYAPIAPLPPGMANIPMFAKLAAHRPAGPNPNMGSLAAAPMLNLTPEQIQEIANNTLNILAARAAAQAGALGNMAGEDAKSPPLTSAENFKEGNVGIKSEEERMTGKGGEEKNSHESTAPAADTEALPISPTSPMSAASLQPTPELRETVRTMMASPQWRAALLAKLQMNRAISAEQAAKMGLRPAAPPNMPQMTMPPLGFPPNGPPMMRPMMPITYYNAPMAVRPRSVPKPHKIKKRKSGAKTSLPTSGEDTPLAVRREGRARKAVDYSKFFKEDDLGSDGGSGESSAEASGSEDEGGPRVKKVMGKRLRTETPVRRHAAAAEADNSEESYEEDEDEDGGMRESRSSEDVGVEKILSHRVKEGKNEFLVKFHNLSYAHVEWIGEEEMLAESNGSSRIKRFLSKPLALRHYSDKHPFNPDYTRIDRIVHGWEHPDENNPQITTASYLVKWMGLPYSEATWEKKDAILSLPDGADRLAEYERRPSLEERRAKTAPTGWRPDRNDHQNMTESPVYKGANALRPYQLEGVDWLLYCWTNRQSCIIADEMGLGKTVQSVAFLDLLYKKYAVRGPFLVVAPLSTIPHWEREFEAWTDLNVIVYRGNIPSRDMMAEYEFYYRTADEKIVPEYYKFDVMITTYEMALAGFEHLQSIVWRAAVFDEAHRLKNRMSKASETLKALQIEHKILLTGTPLQNNIEELWSLLNFLQPNRFFSESQFKVEYGNLQRSEDVIKLQDLLKPLMLRRLKEDVEKSIPVKEETVVEVELTSVQKRHYRAILERNFAFLTKGCRGTNAPNLINATMELRKCCIHPYLIKGAEDRILTECGVAGGSFEEQMHCMVQASGKLVLVDKLLRRLREHGHRVLIFSQMSRCLDLLVDYLKWREYPFERIDGAIKGELRQAAIDRFCDLSTDSFVFLLCTRAGGVGINLTAADTVIIFDSDWNPQNDIQAQARCHRIGQTKSVKVYRLLTRNTYEREMFDKAGLKLGLDRAVLRKILPNETLEGATHNPQLSKKEVEMLLKKGAYGLLMENDDDSIKFCEEDIDQILARRTTVIRHDGNAQAAEGGSIFSKASFAAAADEMDIDIDDPNFWELWARRLDLDPRQLLSSSGVVIDEPRIKRQARRLKTQDLNLDDLEKVLANQAAKEEVSVDAKAGEPQLWTSSERARFLLQLLQIGIHRFENMLPQFPGRTKNDLIACTRGVVKHCLEAMEGSEDTRIREDNEKLLLAHLDFDRSAVEGEMVDEATGKIDLAAAELQTENTSIETSTAVKGFSRADIPFSGASRRQIMEFKSFLREAPSELLKQLTERARSILLRLQLLDFIRQLVEGHATVVAQKSNVSKGKGKPKRGKLVVEDEEALQDEIEYHLPVPNIVGAAPTRGWGKAEDEALVVGVYKHGFGKYEELRKKSAIFAEYSHSTDSELPDDAEEGTKWPSREELDNRLKKVVLAMEKRTQAAAKLAIQAMNVSQGGRRRGATFGDEDDEAYEEDPYQQPDEIRRRQSRGNGVRGGGKTPRVLNTRWSKRDRGEFQRAVMNFGLPEEVSPGSRDWTLFKECGSFAATIMRAGDRAFDEYCELFVKGCRAATEKRGGRKGKARDDNLVATQDEEDEAYEEKGGGDEDAMDGSGNYPGSPSGLPLIPMERAKKALARIDLFHRLRLQILSLPDLEGYLERSRKTSGLPSWWETPRHDVALLQAVGKHGLGRWDLVILDEELPFRKIYQDYDPEAFVDAESIAAEPTIPEAPRRGRKKKVVVTKGLPSGAPLDLEKIEWPAETTVTRRIESLIEMIANEERRRARAAEADSSTAATTTASTTSATGKRRRSVKLKMNEKQAPAETPQEEESVPEPLPKKGRRAGRQKSITDYTTRDK